MSSCTDPTLRAPVGLLMELTHRCPLQCAYCSNPLMMDKARDELTGEQWCSVIDQAAALGVLQVHLSGGEPTLRKELEEIISRAAGHGLYTNLITAGIGVSAQRISALQAAGLDHIQLSIQDLDPPTAQAISGYRGGVSEKDRFARAVVAAGIPLTLNFPVHRQNVSRLEAVITYAEQLGAERLEVAHVQYYGWGLHNRAWLMPTRAQVDESTALVAAHRARLRGIMQIDYVVPDYYAARPKPCMGGWGRTTMNVTPRGRVLPCHAAESIPGLTFDTVLERPLREIWLQSSAFNAFRGTDWMPEPCRSCPQAEVDWGGCRCQALALTGNAAATDPACALSPHHAHMQSLAQADLSAAPAQPLLRNPRNAEAVGEG